MGLRMRGRDRRGFGLMGLGNERVCGWKGEDGCDFVEGFAVGGIMRYDALLLGFLPGLGLDAHLCRVIKALFVLL